MAHKTIVVEHHGALKLESRTGEGSTFIIRLPLQASTDGKETGERADNG